MKFRFTQIMCMAGGAILLAGCGYMKIDKASKEAMDVAVALVNYRFEYGGLPPGPAGANMTALRGKNPKGITFLQLPRARFDSSGSLLDPWGAPYELDISKLPAITVRSAGPDGRLGTPDDVRVTR